MPALGWLVLAAAAGIGAYAVGWPAWRSSRSRDRRDANAERYLAWRGRATRGGPSRREGMTVEERRRVAIGVALGVVAIVALIAFFAAS